MPIGDQHEGGIALGLSVGLAALPGGLDQLLDLVRCQVFALAQIGVGRSAGHCPVLVCWRDQPELRFCLHFAASSGIDCPECPFPVNQSDEIGRNIESLSGPALNVYCSLMWWSA